MVADQLAKWHGGASTRCNKIPVLEEGMALNSLNINLDDMQFAQLAGADTDGDRRLVQHPATYLGATTATASPTRPRSPTRSSSHR